MQKASHILHLLTNCQKKERKEAMEQERQSIRIGLAVIAWAVLLRICGMGVWDTAARFLTKPEVASFLLYMETGKIVRHYPPEEQTPVPEQTVATTQTPPTTHTYPTMQTHPEQTPLPQFNREDAALVEIRNHCGYEADIPAMLVSDLRWDLTQDGPAVLIVHTHATESYTKASGQNYTESSAYRTLDEHYNMVSIGSRIAEALRAGGIEVIHDQTFHDYPSYTASYGNSRSAIQAYLQEYPSIRVVLDIHRDAADLEDGQLTTSAMVDGKASSQLMMVVGTDANGLHHPSWTQNMALAIKLTALLEKRWPGLTRPISFRSERFNQDLSTGAMLIEVGAAGDSHEQALTAADALAQGLLTLCRGTATVDSTN